MYFIRIQVANNLERWEKQQLQSYGNEEMDSAREEAARVLKINPQHRGARELIDKLSHNRDAS